MCFFHFTADRRPRCLTVLRHAARGGIVQAQLHVHLGVHGGATQIRVEQQVSPLAVNRFAKDPLLYTTPHCQVKKTYPNTDGVNNVLSANRFAAKGLTGATHCWPAALPPCAEAASIDSLR